MRVRNINDLSLDQIEAAIAKAKHRGCTHILVAPGGRVTDGQGGGTPTDEFFKPYIEKLKVADPAAI